MNAATPPEVVKEQRDEKQGHIEMPYAYTVAHAQIRQKPHAEESRIQHSESCNEHQPFVGFGIRLSDIQRKADTASVEDEALGLDQLGSERRFCVEKRGKGNGKDQSRYD